MLSLKGVSSRIVLLPLLLLFAGVQSQAPQGEGTVEDVVRRADLKAGGLVATAVEPPPSAVQTDPASLPKKLPPKASEPPRKLHPRLLEWLEERRPDEIVKVVITFEDSVEIPRFPEIDPGSPRDDQKNSQALAASESLVRALKEKRAPAYERHRKELAEYRAEVVETFWLIDAVVAYMPLGHVPLLALHHDVLSIVPVDSGEPPPRGRDRDKTNDIIRGRAMIGSDPYFKLDEGYIGLLDSGLQFNHSLLVPPTKVDFRRDCVNGGEDCNTGPINPVDDCMDHGTATGVILVGSGMFMGTMDDTLRGVTAMTLDSFKVYPSIFSGTTCISGLDTAAATRGFQAAVAALDKVIVAEMQGALQGVGSISKAANAAYDAGAVVIAANGNSGASSGNVTEPARASRVLGVGAFGVDDPLRLTIREQSRGPATDGRVKPDIQAPTKTESASIKCGAVLCTPGSDVDFQTFGGTSGATPYAAGAAALLRNRVGRATGSGSVDPGLVYALMILSGEKTDFDNERGAGPIRLPMDGTLRWGAAFVHHGQTLEIPIVFDPPEGHLDAAIWWPEDGVECRHNDIDLMIVDPAGRVKESSISIPSVFERVRFQGAMQGRWSVQIHGYSVNRYFPQKVYFAIFNRPTPP